MEETKYEFQRTDIWFEEGDIIPESTILMYYSKTGLEELIELGKSETAHAPDKDMANAVSALWLKEKVVI